MVRSREFISITVLLIFALPRTSIQSTLSASVNRHHVLRERPKSLSELAAAPFLPHSDGIPKSGRHRVETNALRVLAIAGNR